MGVYGTYGAFNGLGKPSIKLEFEDNDELLAFQQRMQEPGDGNDDPDGGGNFTQGEQVLDRLSRLATGRPYLKATPGGEASNEEPVEGANDDEETRKYNFYLMLTSDIETIQSKKFSPQLLNDFEENDRDYRINTPIGEVIIKKGLIYGADRHLFKHIYYYFNVLQKTLEDPVCIFTSTDDKGVKNKTFIKCFYLDGVELMSIVSPVTPNELVLKTTYKPNGYNQVWELFKRGGEDIIYLKSSINDLHGLGNPRIITPSFNVVEFRLPVIITKNGAKSCVSEEKSLDGYGDFYTVRDNRKRSKKEPDKLAANRNMIFEKVDPKCIKNYNHKLWAHIEALKESDYNYPAMVQFDGDTYIKINRQWSPDGPEVMMPIYVPEQKINQDTFKGGTTSINAYVDLTKCVNVVNGSNLAYVTQQYYADLYTSAVLRKYDLYIGHLKSAISNSNSDYAAELQKLIKYFVEYYSNPKKYNALYISGQPAEASISAKNFTKPGIFDGVSLGKTANNTLYNNLDILDFRGMQPTYRQLSNYDGFFKPAANKNSLKGWGLNDTKKLIADICRNHYKECAAIAKHLKADTKLQSAFNLWHWLHHNIRYEYDREGREEVRTPARTWADRHRGVDCDCLSVFAWCVLKCMGYAPAFELAAFRNKPAYSHIYINLDGIVVDRVWYVFNSRPPFITKTELFKVGMLDNLGQLF